MVITSPIELESAYKVLMSIEQHLSTYEQVRVELGEKALARKEKHEERFNLISKAIDEYIGIT